VAFSEIASPFDKLRTRNDGIDTAFSNRYAGPKIRIDFRL